MKDTHRNTYLAADFGGGSGRIIAGSLLHGKLELEEVHRFPNRQLNSVIMFIGIFPPCLRI